MSPMIQSKRFLFATLMLAALSFPVSLPGQDQPAGCELDSCEVVLMDVESGTDWTTNCDIVTIPGPAPGEPDMRQICDPTFLIIRDPTCGPSGTESNFTELTEEEYCFEGKLPCNVVGFRSFCMEATLSGDYKISNVGASAGDLIFNLAGCTKIYRQDDIFNPLCALEEGGERIGLTLPAPSEEEPMPSIKGKFDPLSVRCSLEGAEAAALFADVCEDPANFCFDAFSDGFIEVTLSTGNLIAETILRGSSRVCASYATFDFEVLSELVEPNCSTCNDIASPNGVVPVSFVLPDDGNEAVLSDYEDPANYQIVIDDLNDGDNQWDQTIVPDSNGTFEFTGLADGDYAVAIIYVPLAGDSLPGDPEACGFCVSNATVGLIAEPQVDAVITDDCVPGNSGNGPPVAGNGAIDLTVSGGDNIGFLWDNGATTPGIENLEAGQYCVTITYGPPASGQDPSGRCSVCLCFEVKTFNLTCEITGDPVVCGEASTTLTAVPDGGSGNYSYSWNTGQTTESITVSPDTSTRYEVTVTDEAFNGDCFSVCAKEVQVFNPACTIVGDLEVWLGAPATLTAQVPNENGNFEYLWSTDARTPSITVYPTETTTYSVIVTELDDEGNPGCSFECSETVWVTEPSCVIEGDELVCKGESTVLTAIAPSKDRNYQFKWSTGSDQPSITVFPAEVLTTYTVTITDVSEDGTPLYSFVCEHQIEVIDPTCIITGDDSLCPWKSTLLTAQVSGGTGNYSYQWSSGEKGESINVMPMTTTTYEVTVTDIGAGCTFTCDITVEVSDLSCVISGDGRICEGEPAVLTVEAEGGSGTYRYHWNTGETSPSITVSPQVDKRYRVTVTDLDDAGDPVCYSVCTYELAVSNPACSIVHQLDAACEEKGAFSFIIQGGFPPYTYEVITPDATIASGTVAQNGELVSVENLMPGEYTVQIEDGEGCTTTCRTDIATIPDLGELTGCLACNDKVNITLNQDCAVPVTLDMLTEGDIGACGEEESLRRILEVIVYDGKYPTIGGAPRPDNILDQCGVFTYEIKLKKGYEDCFSWTKCWGQVNAEDKSATVAIKPEKVRGIYKYEEHYGETRFTPYDCTSEDFELCFEDSLEDLYVDCGAFEFNYLICEDLDSIYQNPRSYNDPGYPYFVGYPLVQDDCCGTMELIKVEDDLEQAPCEDRYGQITTTIRRTFIFQNSEGFKTTAVQEIYFYRPKIFLPDCKLHVDICAFESAGGKDELLGPENLSNLIREEEDPLPYYFNGICEKNYLTGHSCDLTLSYEDQEFSADCGKKIIRIWTVLDWCWEKSEGRSRYALTEGSDCYGTLFPPASEEYTHAAKQIVTFEQHIIMETTGEMSIEGPDLQVSTGPFQCTAVIAPPPPQVDDCIAVDFEFELWGYVTDPKTGTKIYERIGYSNDGVLADVSPGVYDLFYQLSDECGRTYSGVQKNGEGEWVYDREGACVLTVSDDTGPVAVCNDELNISIGGPGTTNGGLARLQAAEADEGSWDNCGPVERQVRRAIDRGCLANYAEMVHHLSWPSDYLARFEKGIIVYLAVKDVPGLDIRRNDPLIAQEPGGHFYSWWADAAFFTCCDVSTDATDKVAVELRTTDTAGNINICWLNTLVEDKLPPGCEVQNKTTLCTGLDFDPMDAVQVAGRFGAPEEIVEIRDNCGASISEEVIWTPGNCGTGLIERAFTVTDASGRSALCTQEIEVLEVNDYEIVFPGDEASAACGVEPERDISTQSFACDLLAVNKDTTRYEALGGECFQLLITYRVINWCEYDGESTEAIEVPRDWDSDEDFTEDQLVRVFPGGDLLPDEPGEQVVTWTQPDGDIHWLDAGEYTALTPGFWQYSQLLRVYDNAAPEVEVATESLSFCAYGSPDENCDGNIDIAFNLQEECTPDDTEVRSLKLDVFNEGNPRELAAELGYTLTQNDDGDYRITGKLPVGDHTFVLNVTDGCGNLSGKRIPFEVVDCKSPAPICIQTLSVDLMPVDTDGDGAVDGGMNTVRANDFIAAPIDDCSPFDTPEKVKYFVFKDKDLDDGAVSITLDSLTPEHTSAIFTCEEEGTELVYVVALDRAGNFDYCTVMAVVQPGISPSPCGSSGGNGTISGIISDESAGAVAGVSVQLSGRTSMVYTTENSGNYQFSDLVSGYDYSVSPIKDDDHLNGVSTFDLILISKHILGVKLLDSPYKMIAADVNNSQSITTLDLIQLRKLILSVNKQFSNNTSWRFVDADYGFPDPLDPWAEVFPEIKNVNNLPGSMNADFTAVKIGDVNGSAVSNSLQRVDKRSSTRTFELSASTGEVMDGQHLMKRGNEYRIDFTAADIAEVEGLQFTLNFDRGAVELVDILYGLAQEENFGVFASEGMITTSWNAGGNSDFRIPTSDLPLFSLVLRAKSDTHLEEVLDISSRLTQAEAYSTAGELMDVALHFGQEVFTSAEIELYQNQPNPFYGQTVIGFNLPESTQVTLAVRDVNGQVVQVIAGHYEEGYSEVSLNNIDLPSGILFYTLKTEQRSLTRKMIHLG